jgi:hypothetical protein
MGTRRMDGHKKKESDGLHRNKTRYETNYKNA